MRIIGLWEVVWGVIAALLLMLSFAAALAEYHDRRNCRMGGGHVQDVPGPCSAGDCLPAWRCVAASGEAP